MLFATLLALASATLHAGWNLLVKRSEDRDLALLGQFALGGLVAAPGLLVTGLPGRAALGALVGSAVVHIGYTWGLAAAYQHGDFSLAYPMARGGGALMAAIGGALFLGDAMSPGAWAAIAVVALGVMSLSLPGGSARSVGWAAFTAVMIATYSLIDASGTRAAVSGASYGLAMMPMTAVTVVGSGLVRGRRADLARSIRSNWPRHLAAGTALVAAYTLVLIALRHAPVGYVSVLRESSVVLGAGAGWLLLRERLGRRRLISSAVMACGLIALIIVR